MQTETEANLPVNRRLPRDDWGDIMEEKEDKTIRISFVNVNGIGRWAKSAKSEDIKRHIKDREIDAIGLCELGINWNKVHSAHTLWDRTKQWVNTRRIAVAYNTTERVTNRVQQGGTATLLVNDVAHQCKTVGFDTTGLGRWSWVVITGKQRCVRTTVVTSTGRPHFKILG